MTLDDFIEHFYARLRGFSDDLDTKRVQVRADVFSTPGAVRAFLHDVAAAHLFFLGDEEAINESVRQIGDDVMLEVRSGLPMPFENIAMLWRSGAHGWVVEWLRRSPRLSTSTEEFFCYALFAEEHLARKEIQTPMFVQTTYSPNRPVEVRVYKGRYVESCVAEAAGRAAPSRDPVALPPVQGDVKWVSNVLFQCAAISHPALYVVRATPSLTPREVRIAQKNGGRPPDRKRPRFLVIDHDGLLKLRQSSGGDSDEGERGSSPRPHERRGHWRRLAEHCVHARAAGRDRVWVRPAVVGDLEFADARNRCEVILDPMPTRDMRSAAEHGRDE